MRIPLEVKILACLVACFGVISVMMSHNEQKELSLERHLKLTPGYVIKKSSSGYRGGSCELTLRFEFNGNILERGFMTSNPKCPILSSWLLIAVDSSDSENAELLIHPDDFSSLKLTMPDSLTWLRTCFSLL
jgi:hypothetical protein